MHMHFADVECPADSSRGIRTIMRKIIRRSWWCRDAPCSRAGHGVHNDVPYGTGYLGWFLDRVATLPATLHYTPQLEIVTYEYNRRDPEVMGLLESYAEAINAKGLRLRSGKKLHIKIEPAPKPRHPPPPGSRALPVRCTQTGGTGDRFKR